MLVVLILSSYDIKLLTPETVTDRAAESNIALDEERNLLDCNRPGVDADSTGMTVSAALGGHAIEQLVELRNVISTLKWV